MADSAFNPGGKAQYHGGSFRAEDVRLNWSDSLIGDGMLVQEAQWHCARQVSILYEIGSPAVYYVGNRRSGTANLRRVVGGRGQFKEMARSFGNICSPKNLIIDARQQACGRNVTAGDGGGAKYTCVDATLNDLGGATQAEAVVISEMMAFVFLDMYYE